MSKTVGTWIFIFVCKERILVRGRIVPRVFPKVDAQHMQNLGVMVAVSHLDLPIISHDFKCTHLL